MFCTIAILCLCYTLHRVPVCHPLLLFKHMEIIRHDPKASRDLQSFVFPPVRTETIIHSPTYPTKQDSFSLILQ